MSSIRCHTNKDLPSYPFYLLTQWLFLGQKIVNPGNQKNYTEIYFITATVQIYQQKTQVNTFQCTYIIKKEKSVLSVRFSAMYSCSGIYKDPPPCML